jgi:hypothetical protein
MLSGRKPLAMFYEVSSELPWEEIIPEDAFAPHVQAGLIRRQDIEVNSTLPSGIPTKVTCVFYVLQGQEWRIQLMIVLVRALYAGGGWNETCERVQGTLLGYTNEENDIHCARMFKRSAS